MAAILEAMASAGWEDFATEQHVQRAVRRRLKVLPVEDVLREVEAWSSIKRWVDLPGWAWSKEMGRRARALQH